MNIRFIINITLIISSLFSPVPCLIYGKPFLHPFHGHLAVRTAPSQNFRPGDTAWPKIIERSNPMDRYLLLRLRTRMVPPMSRAAAPIAAAYPISWLASPVGGTLLPLWVDFTLANT